MQTTYLIISSPNSTAMLAAMRQLCADISDGYHVGQLFFYSDAVALGTLDCYPEAVQQLLDYADEHDIAVHLCSAGFQKRGYQLSVCAQQDFAFKGVGQFMAEIRQSDHIRVF